MKLTQFCKNNVPALGIWTDRGIVDPAVEAARRGVSAPATMLEAIRGGAEAISLLGNTGRRAHCGGSGAGSSSHRHGQAPVHWP